MKKASSLGIAAFLLLSCGCSSPYRGRGLVTPAQPQQDSKPSACTALDIALSFDSADGEFNGMSHSGAYLVLTNIGLRTCTVPRRPQITWLDITNAPLNAQADTPKGMHPGPVLTPVVLAPGKSARSALRWVSGEVYDHNTCVNVAKGTAKLDQGEVTAPLQARICGDATVGPRFEQQLLQPQGQTAAPAGSGNAK